VEIENPDPSGTDQEKRRQKRQSGLQGVILPRQPARLGCVVQNKANLVRTSHGRGRSKPGNPKSEARNPRGMQRASAKGGGPKNAKQTQFAGPGRPEIYAAVQNKANLRRAEMNLKLFIRRAYENSRAFGAEENKANQSQFQGPAEVMRARFLWAGRPNRKPAAPVWRTSRISGCIPPRRGSGGLTPGASAPAGSTTSASVRLHSHCVRRDGLHERRLEQCREQKTRRAAMSLSLIRFLRTSGHGALPRANRTAAAKQSGQAAKLGMLGGNLAVWGPWLF
jgi:GTP cyclohydrolase II